MLLLQCRRKTTTPDPLKRPNDPTNLVDPTGEVYTGSGGVVPMQIDEYVRFLQSIESMPVPLASRSAVPTGGRPGYWDRYFDYTNRYTINVGRCAYLLSFGLWPKCLAPATLGRGPVGFFGSNNPFTSVPRAVGAGWGGSNIARLGANGIGVVTCAIGGYNMGVYIGGFVEAAFPD
jgi:hypothetical protein